MKCCGQVGTANYHCARCHQTFGTLTSFDDHHVHDAGSAVILACAPPRVLGLVQDARGVWRTPEGLLKYERVRDMMAGFSHARGGRAAQTA